MAALGDSTRRAIYERLRRGPAAVAEIAAELPVSRPAVSQHLKVLRKAQLVSSRPDGKRQLYRLELGGLREFRDYLDRFWAVALDQYQSALDRDEGGAQ
jgi:DNA-binding transcriptional ArsR family regulator